MPVEIALPPQRDDFLWDRHLLPDVKLHVENFGIPVLDAVRGGHDRTMNERSATKPEIAVERTTAHIPLYKVLLHNDDQNTMEHVVKSLMKVFRFGQAESERIMLEAHRSGMALCIIEPLEQAELHRDQLRSFSLISSIEQA